MRGVNNANRKVQLNEAQYHLRNELWNNLSDRVSGARGDDELQHLVQCCKATAYLASRIVEEWDWSLQTGWEIQREIFRWRLDWLKSWKSPPHGVGRDTTLLPAAWKRIAHILETGTYPVSDLAPHAAAILNFDTNIMDGEVWEDLSQPGRQDPIDATTCSVIWEHTWNKISRLRTPRARKIQQPSWAVPRVGTSDPFRYLPSRRREDRPVYKDPLSMPFDQISEGSAKSSPIRKASSQLNAEISRV